MGFLPDTLAEWVGLIGAISALLTVYWAAMLRFIRAPLIVTADRDRDKVDERFSQHGKRIGDLESEDKATAARVEGHEKLIERMDFKLTNISEQFGRHDARLERFLATVERQERERLEEDRKFAERLASFEAKIDSFGTLLEPAFRLLLTNQHHSPGNRP